MLKRKMASFQDLCRHFRPPPIDRRHLKARGISGLPSAGRFYACLVALSMDFSRALRRCQPAAVAGHVDNYLPVSSDEAQADESLDRIAVALEAAGLMVHAPDRAADVCGSPGVELRRGRQRAIEGRSVWGVKLAVGKLLRRVRASGHLARALIGHLTWASM
ncbi:unnamed protein product, partial [Prorocentrum cordatum]